MILKDQIVIRPAEWKDHVSIAALHASNWRDTYRGIMGDHYLDHLVDQDRLDTWQERFTRPIPGQHILLAEADGRLIGFCCLQIDEDPDFGTLIDNLHVANISRGKGVGGILLRKAAAIVQSEANARKMYLWVYDSNRNARAAYERLGAQLVETIEKPNEEGTPKLICRYAWDGLSPLL